MGTKNHLLSNIDHESKTGDCSTCGRIGLNRSKGGILGWRCKNAAKGLWAEWNPVESANRVVVPLEERKSLLVSLAGGKCVFCGYERCFRSLHFHHVDPNTKEIEIAAKGSWGKIETEIRKCILVCANCHGEIHDGIISQDMIAKAHDVFILVLDEFESQRRKVFLSGMIHGRRATYEAERRLGFKTCKLCRLANRPPGKSARDVGRYHNGREMHC